MIIWALIGVLVIFLEPVYIAINQDPVVAKNAAAYFQIVYPFLFLDAIAMPLEQLASNQKVVEIAAVAIWGSSAYFWAASYYLYSVRDMGLTGMGYAVGSMFAWRALIIFTMVNTSKKL